MLKESSAPVTASEHQDDGSREELRKAHGKLRLAAKIAQRMESLQSSIIGVPAGRAKESTPKNVDGIREDAHQSAQILRRMMPVAADTANKTSSDDPDLSELCRGRRILLADDDPMVLSSARMALVDAGFSVVSCSSGEEAWKVFSKSPKSFDLLLSDISMPSLDGASLVQQARLLHPHLRVILMSGYFDERSAADLVRGGKGSFLAKPFGLSQLVDEVRARLLAS